MRDDALPEITPTLLLQAYASGVFPMAESAESSELFWVDPRERMIALYMVQVSDFDRTMLRNQFRTMIQSAYADAPRR